MGAWDLVPTLPPQANTGGKQRGNLKSNIVKIEDKGQMWSVKVQNSGKITDNSSYKSRKLDRNVNYTIKGRTVRITNSSAWSQSSKI